MPETDDDLNPRALEIWNYYVSNNYPKYETVAKHFDMSKSAVQRAIIRARKLMNAQNISPDVHSKLSALGFGDLNGIHSGWLHRKNDDTGEWASVYVQTGDNEVRDAADVFREALDNIQPTPSLHAPPEYVDEDLLNLQPLTDSHIGLSCWADEVGEDYDTEIAREAHLQAFQGLFPAMPRAAVTICLNIGDMLHANDGSAMTPKSKHILDVSARFAKVMPVALQIEVDRIEMARQTAKRVIYRMVPGNHDPNAAFMLAMSLHAWYRNDPVVEVDLSPCDWWRFPWGKTLLAATHGDKISPAKMGQYVAEEWPEMWGQSRARFISYGHYHRGAVTDNGATEVRCFATLCPRDSYSAPRFPGGGRRLHRLTFHKTRGLLHDDRYNHMAP